MKTNKIKELYKDYEEIYFAFGFLVFFVVLQISTNKIDHLFSVSIRQWIIIRFCIIKISKNETAIRFLLFNKVIYRKN